MTNRIDREYLKPQILIFEKALKEWWYICLFIVFPWFIYSNWDDYEWYLLIFGCIGPFAFLGVLYMVPRTLIASYFAMRKVVFKLDD